MKLEVGMKIRTKWGYICELININDFREPSMKYGVEASYLKDIMFIGDEDIENAKHSLIELVKVGDYVNGSKVIEISEYNGEKYVYVEETEYSNANQADINVYYKNEYIETIVTKEQFEKMQYEVV